MFAFAGLRIGYVKAKSDPPKSYGYLTVFRYLSWILPNRVMKFYHMIDWFING